MRWPNIRPLWNLTTVRNFISRLNTFLVSLLSMIAQLIWICSNIMALFRRVPLRTFMTASVQCRDLNVDTEQF